MEHKDKVKILKSFGLFKKLTVSQLLELAKVVREVKFKPRETIIEEGETGYDAFLIYQGSVRVYRLSEDGKEVALSVKGRGDIVGEMALFDHGVRTAFVEAIEETHAFRLKKEDLENILQSSPQTAIELLKILSTRLGENGELIESLTTKSLKERVISVLFTLHTYIPKIEVTQEQIAALVGATRPRVSEILAELKKEGFLDIKDHELIVLQRTA